MSVNAKGSRIGYSRPSDTNDTLVFTASLHTEVTRIHVCNVGGSAQDFDMYHVSDGVSFSEGDLIYKGQQVATDEPYIDKSDSPNSGIMLSPGDSLGVKASSANDLIFHIYGVTASLAPRNS